MMFAVKRTILPHDGVIPGARGHKKIVVPAGTPIYTITYGTRYYWAAYLDEATATKTARNLEATVLGHHRRQISLPALITWNFKHVIPIRIARQPRNLK